MLVYILIFNMRIKYIDGLSHEYVHDLSPKHPLFASNEIKTYFFLVI